jgi:O-antigen/teichoic acid export membrane protein
MFKQKAFKEISLLWIGSLLGAFIAFLTQVLLARHLAIDNFGQFSSALATIAIIAPLAGFGISQFWLQIFGEEGYSAFRWLKGSFQFILISTSTVLGCLFLWIIFGPDHTTYKLLLTLLSSFILGQIMIELISVQFQLEEKYLLLSVWQFMPHFLRLLLIICFLYISPLAFTMLLVAKIYFAISASIFILGIFKLMKMRKGQLILIGHDKPVSDSTALLEPANMWSVISHAWPFGLSYFFYFVYNQSSIVLLNHLDSSEAAATFNVAFNIIMAIFLMPRVIYDKYLLPKIHRWANHDKLKLYEIHKIGQRYMIISGIIIMICTWATSFWIVPFLFGQKYIHSVQILNILALSIPIYFMASNSGAPLASKKNNRIKVQYMGIVAIANISLNFFLIPIHGAIGASISIILSHLLLLALFHYGTQKYVFENEGTTNV